METLGKIFFSIGLAVSSLFGFTPESQAPVQYVPENQTPAQQLGSFTPVQASQFTLSGAGVTSAATTIQLTSFKLPDPARTPITMAMFGAIGYAVIEPQTNKIENITFTGVTQNANGTATLTGVTRGINFVSPYTGSATRALSHAGGSYLILSNPAAFYGTQFAFVNDDAAITGVWRFNSYLPETSISATTSNQFTNKAYVDNVANQGAATSTETNGGIVELGTLAEQASSFDGGANKPTVLQTKNSTSTCQVVGSYNIVASTTTGRLDKGCFDQTAMYSFTGARNNFLNASSTGFSAGYLYVGSTATTSISNTGVVTLATTTAGVLKTSPTGVVYAGNPTRYVLVSNTDTVIGSEDTFATSTAGLLIPGGTLSASSTIQVKIKTSSCTVSGGGSKSCTVYVRTSTGVTIAEVGVGSDNNSVTGYGGWADITVASNNSDTFSSQISNGLGLSAIGQTPTSVSFGGLDTTSTVNFASDVTLKIVGGAASSGTFTIESYSIIATP